MIDTGSLPESPGCYLFKDASKSIIYVGKAKHIQKRVSSYFQKRDLDPKTRVLIRNIASVDFIATDNETEALILENTLIKRHQPKYNIDLKDSKRYAHIQITDEPFPRLLIARKVGGKGRYFGPFVSALERNYILTALTRSFKLRTCKRLPKRACLRHHIGICSAPCISMIGDTEYNNDIAGAAMVLKGRIKELLSKLQHDMDEHSKNLRYEQAIAVRDQIHAIGTLQERQNMERRRAYDEDIINYVIKDGNIYLLLFNIYKGTLVNKQEFMFDDSTDFLEEFLVQYYSENPIPAELILPASVEPCIKEFLEKIRGSKVSVTVPKLGEKRQLLKLVKRNIELSFFGEVRRLEDLKTVLGLNKTPAVIECFDISHLSGTSTVGSMVQFRYGKPDKDNYRRFRIRTVAGVDDYMAIAEVVRRRYRRLKEEDAELPNLIVIDGGKGQLTSAIQELKALEVRLPVISIAKQFEEIYVPGMKKPLKLDRKRNALKLLQEIRDEAHRFAISYNRLLRKKELIK